MDCRTADGRDLGIAVAGLNASWIISEIHRTHEKKKVGRKGK